MPDVVRKGKQKVRKTREPVGRDALELMIDDFRLMIAPGRNGFTTEARRTQSGPFDFAQDRLCGRNWKICVNRRNLRMEVLNTRIHSTLPTVFTYEKAIVTRRMWMEK